MDGDSERLTCYTVIPWLSGVTGATKFVSTIPMTILEVNVGVRDVQIQPMRAFYIRNRNYGYGRMLCFRCKCRDVNPNFQTLKPTLRLAGWSDYLNLGFNPFLKPLLHELT